MADKNEVGVLFPAAGVDVSSEFQRQPPQTTPVGENVRAFDVLAERGRGGSRAGLSRFIDATVDGANVIQHLSVVVDPQADALGSSESDIDDVPDPSDGGRNLLTDGSVRLVRRGGNAFRHLKPQSSTPTGIALVQVGIGRQDTDDGGANHKSVLFGTGTPAVNGFLLVFIARRSSTLASGAGITFAVINGTGTAYTQIGTTREITWLGPDFGMGAVTEYISISAYRLKSTGVVADKTIDVTASAACPFTIWGTEFVNVHQTLPVSDNQDVGVDNTPTMTLEVGPDLVPVAGSAVCGFFQTEGVRIASPLNNGFTQPFADSISKSFMLYKFGVSTSQTPSMGMGGDSESHWAGFGVTLRKKP